MGKVMVMVKGTAVTVKVMVKGTAVTVMVMVKGKVVTVLVMVKEKVVVMVKGGAVVKVMGQTMEMEMEILGHCPGLLTIRV
jgi:hypothetical protein